VGQGSGPQVTSASQGRVDFQKSVTHDNLQIVSLLQFIYIKLKQVVWMLRMKR